MQITVKDLSWHRNGISGVGFYAILFEWIDSDETPWVTRNMLAHVFDDPGYCAVHCLDMPTIKFGVNSWRGDHFEPLLREAIAEHRSKGSIRLGPFGIPTS